MASKSEPIPDARDKFSQSMPAEKLLFAAKQLHDKWFRKAVDTNLEKIVCDEEADPKIPDPGLPAANLTQAQLDVHKETTKLYKTQQKELAELASFMRNSITDETYLTLVVSTANELNAYLEAREMYIKFREIFIQVCAEDLNKVLRNLRKLFVPGQSLTLHTVEHVQNRNQITLARGTVSAQIEIDDLVETLQNINTPETCDRTINEIREESELEAEDEPEKLFKIFVKNILKYDRNKKFGLKSCLPSEANHGVAHNKVDVSIEKLDMVKESVQESEMTRILKLLEAVVVGKTGGGVPNRASKTKPTITKDAVKANREMYKDVDLEDDCPVHPGNPPRFPCSHTWGKCSSYTGQPWRKEKKN
jgi:hypothetical protein